MMRDRSLVERWKLWRLGCHDVASEYLGIDLTFESSKGRVEKIKEIGGKVN